MMMKLSIKAILFFLVAFSGTPFSSATTLASAAAPVMAVDEDAVVMPPTAETTAGIGGLLRGGGNPIGVNRRRELTKHTPLKQRYPYLCMKLCFAYRKGHCPYANTSLC
jgi:hypothetical protein